MIDWFKILVDLQRCGLDLRAVSDQAGVRYWPLYRVWRQEHKSLDLNHEEGQKVLALWAQKTQREITDAPKLVLAKVF